MCKVSIILLSVMSFGIDYFKNNYKSRSEIKIISKLEHLCHVGININNVAVNNCGIVIFFKLMS